MKFTIHRGAAQIGGCVTKYEYEGWRLFVDFGEELPRNSYAAKPLDIEGLNCGDTSKSALLITHYHGDHIGNIPELPSQLPIFMGQTAKEIQDAYSKHMSGVSERDRRLHERLESVAVFKAGEQFEFGPFKITPVTIDHSAFDSYAFRIEAAGLSVFHTGDFRTHGFRSKALPKVLEKYIDNIHYVVCEATNIRRPDAVTKSESELQRDFQKSFNEHKYNVVYSSSTNIDRLFGLYHAAIRAGRPFYVDSYQKSIMDIVAGRDSIWGKSNLYEYKVGFEPKVLLKSGPEFYINDKFKNDLASRGYVLMARAGKKFDNLIDQMPSEDRQIYLSMWNGYVDKKKAAYNPALAESVGNNPIYMHTSGHCDMEGLRDIFKMLHPKAILPIHTDDPKAFADLFCDEWPIILLNDGESFSPINMQGKDTAHASILLRSEPDESLNVDNPDGLHWWKLDSRGIGEFKHFEDAFEAVSHVVFSPKKVFAYEVEIIRFIDPSVSVIYNKDLSVNSAYCTRRRGSKINATPTFSFKPGDKVLCLKHQGLDAIFPAVVVGPLTKEYLRQDYENNDEAKLFYSSFEEYLEQWSSWDLDSVVVRPLVHLNYGWERMGETTIVNRVHVFPYEESASL